MTICEHFIYTSSPLQDQKGYQVTAKSSGISEETIAELDGYMYPIGLNLRKFKESRSLILLTNDLVVYSKVKNIGYGFDKRPDTLYNHTILIRKKDFTKYENDSRIFEDYYLDDPSKEGYLPFIRLETKKIESAQLDLPKQVIEKFLLGIFQAKKIAILNSERFDLIQNLLSILPPSLRLVSFSSLVPEPDRQIKYQIIQTDKSRKIELQEKDFITIEFNTIDESLKNEVEDSFYKSIRYLTMLARSDDKNRIKQLHENFEKISSGTIEEKLVLVTSFDRFVSSDDKLVKEKYAYDILGSLQNLDDADTAFEYSMMIKDFLNEDDLQKYLPQFEINRLIINSMNRPLDLNNIESLFGELSWSSLETRLQLLNKLIQVKSTDFISNGEKLLLDSRYSYYRSEIMQFFVENEKLHKCIFNILDEKNEQNNNDKKSIFELLIEQALNHNSKLVTKLLIFSIFDFNDTYDSMQFKKILEDILKSKNFQKSADANEVLSFIIKIHKRCGDIIEYIPNSGTSGTTDSNERELLEIIKMMKDFLSIILSYKKSLTPSLRQQLTEEKKSLDQFLIKHKLPNRRGWRPW